MKIMMAQINPTVGDLEGNYQKAAAVMKAAPDETDLVVFPELSVTGYPPKDLLEKPAFVAAVEKIAKEKWARLSTPEIGVLFGSVIRNATPVGNPLQNVAILAQDGKMIAIQAKTLLPTYDVFDEDRYFHPAESNIPMEFKGVKLGVSVCEDVWNDKEYWMISKYPVDPIKNLVAAGADILINLSASPFALGKPEIRTNMLSHIAKRYDKPLIYVNQVGGNDDVVYDGRSLVFDQNGNLHDWLQPYKEGTYSFDTANLHLKQEIVTAWQDNPELPVMPLTFQLSEPWEIYNALVLGTRDYARKTGFKKCVIGLSGGIDSAIVAVIATEAFGKENVLGVGMPSKYSSDHSVSDAKGIAEKLGIDFALIPIKPVHAAYMEMLGTRLKPSEDIRLWEENIQARARGATLMAISNDENRLLLTTGNKSEIAVGYCTLYGDTCGGLAVIADVFKTKVYDLARWINKIREIEIIPKNSIEKPPSAELRPNQKDQDSLPPYAVLDLILNCYVEQSMEGDEIMEHIAKLTTSEEDVDPALVVAGLFSVDKSVQKRIVMDIIKKVDRNEYKRKQLAPGLKITRKAFGTGRQMPIAQKWH